MGNAAALSISDLYGDHATWLRAWLRRHVVCHQRAADLTQDVFCRLLERSEAPIVREPRTYLATIARRLLIDDVRRRDIEAAYVAACAAYAGDEQAISPERIVEAVQTLTTIRDLLSDLPEDCRTAFLLSRLEGWNYSEIARELAVSTSTVKRHVARAFARCYAVAYPD